MDEKNLDKIETIKRQMILRILTEFYKKISNISLNNGNVIGTNIFGKELPSI